MISIFNSSIVCDSVGGPAGYINNLSNGLDAIGIEYNSLFEKTDVSGAKRQEEIHKSKSSLVCQMRAIASFLKRGFLLRRKYQNAVRGCIVIHAHSSEDVVYLRKFFRYKGKIIFTPHRPEPLANEKTVSINLLLEKDSGCILARYFFEMIEKKSYEYCDAAIFPSIHAREIYKSFPGFDSLNTKPTRYVYTGVQRSPIYSVKSIFRTEHDIPEDVFVVAFVGRHSKIKGYDILVSNASEIFELGDCRIVCAGAKSDIEPPKSEKWIELGYIDNVNDLLLGVDVVVIPNRNTYFDLVIVEALSYGCIVVSSATGGNIDLAQDAVSLLLFDADDPRQLCECVSRVYSLNNNEKDLLRRGAIEFYENNCTLEKFAEGYSRAFNELEVLLNG